MKKDILSVSLWTAALCVVMDIFFLLFNFFDITVVWGTILGLACAVLNFILLALSVKKAVEKTKHAGAYMGSSYLLRLMMIAVIVVASIKSPYINYVAVVIPLVFPKVIITVIQGIMKWNKKSKMKAGDDLGGA